jgi:hypothetical protein
MKERPAGITVTIAFSMFLGIVTLILGSLVLSIGGLSAWFGGLFSAESLTSFGQTSAWIGYLSIVSALFVIVVCFGLIAMKKWAWALAALGLALSIVLALALMFTGGVFGFIFGSLSLIMPFMILIYLFSKRTRCAFGIGTA